MSGRQHCFEKSYFWRNIFNLVPFDPWDWLASNFSLQYLPLIKHLGHKNKENDHQLKRLLNVKQVLFISTSGNEWGTAWMICKVILGYEELKEYIWKLTRFILSFCIRYVPSGDLEDIYLEYYGEKKIDKNEIELCTALLLLGWVGEHIGGAKLFSKYSKTSPFLMEDLHSYFQGGLVFVFDCN